MIIYPWQKKLNADIKICTVVCFMIDIFLENGLLRKELFMICLMLIGMFLMKLLICMENIMYHATMVRRTQQFSYCGKKRQAENGVA